MFINICKSGDGQIYLMVYEDTTIQFGNPSMCHPVLLQRILRNYYRKQMIPVLLFSSTETDFSTSSGMVFKSSEDRKTYFVSFSEISEYTDDK